jgi:hypothetical protein
MATRVHRKCFLGKIIRVPIAAKGHGNVGFPLARSAPHLDELARAGRDAALCVAGNGRLVERRDGATVCAPRPGSSGALRREI